MYSQPSQTFYTVLNSAPMCLRNSLYFLLLAFNTLTIGWKYASLLEYELHGSDQVGFVYQGMVGPNTVPDK